MIGSTIAAELDATSTAITPGRCRPLTAAITGLTAIARPTVSAVAQRPRRVAVRNRRSWIGSLVATMNINSAKPMSARNASVGWVATIVRVPVRPMATPAAISPMTTGGATRVGRSVSNGPKRPTATISASVP